MRTMPQRTIPTTKTVLAWAQKCRHTYKTKHLNTKYRTNTLNAKRTYRTSTINCTKMTKTLKLDKDEQKHTDNTLAG